LRLKLRIETSEFTSLLDPLRYGQFQTNTNLSLKKSSEFAWRYLPGNIPCGLSPPINISLKKLPYRWYTLLELEAHPIRNVS